MSLSIRADRVGESAGCRPRVLVLCAMALLFAALAPTGAAWAQTENQSQTISVVPANVPPEPDWTFRVTPYFWLPAMTGDATIKGIPIALDTSVSDLFTETDFVFSLAAEIEAWYRDEWAIAVNGQWSVIETHNNLKGTMFQNDMKANIGLFEVLGFYKWGEWPIGPAGSGPTWSLEPLLGVRITVISGELDFDNFGDVGDQQTFADPFFGSRSVIRFGESKRWTWTTRGDLGGFGVGSSFTWNVAGMFGYDFKIRGVDSTVILGARALSQNYTDGSGSDRFTWDVIQYGPLLGLTLAF